MKRKGTTGKVEPSIKFLNEEKLTFQMGIVRLIIKHDIPSKMVLNIDQTPLAYVSPGKFTFAQKGSTTVPIKGVDGTRQITATFGCSAVGDFLPLQLIYAGKTRTCLPKFDFPKMFDVTYTPNHWSNEEKCKSYFDKVIFPHFEKTKEEHGYPEEQYGLLIMDTFSGQDNDRIIKLCEDNHVVTQIVPHNLTNKFQPLDISVNQIAKSSISSKFNTWYSAQVTNQLEKNVAPTDVNVSMKLSDMKPLHAQWIVEL